MLTTTIPPLLLTTSPTEFSHQQSHRLSTSSRRRRFPQLLTPNTSQHYHNMNPSTKLRATLFVGALALTCGVLLAPRAGEWFHPKSEEKNCSREEKPKSNDENRKKRSSTHSDGDGDRDRLSDSSDGSNPDSRALDHEKPVFPPQPPVVEPSHITAVTSIGICLPERKLGSSTGLAGLIPPPAIAADPSPERTGPQHHQRAPCPGLQELCSIFGAPPAGEKDVLTRIAQPRIQQTCPNPADPMEMSDADPGFPVKEPSSEEAVQATDLGSLEPPASVQDEIASSLSSPRAEKHVLNPLAVPFYPRRSLNQNTAPVSAGKEKVEPKCGAV